MKTMKVILICILTILIIIIGVIIQQGIYIVVPLRPDTTLYPISPPTIYTDSTNVQSMEKETSITKESSPTLTNTGINTNAANVPRTSSPFVSNPTIDLSKLSKKEKKIEEKKIKEINKKKDAADMQIVKQEALDLKEESKKLKEYKKEQEVDNVKIKKDRITRGDKFKKDFKNEQSGQKAIEYNDGKIAKIQYEKSWQFKVNEVKKWMIVAGGTVAACWAAIKIGKALNPFKWITK